MIFTRLRVPAMLADIVAYQAFNRFHYIRYPEQVEAGKRATEHARSAGDVWELTEALFMTQLGLCFLGRLDEASHIEEELVPLAEQVGHLGGLMCAGRVRAVIGICRTGDFRSFAAFTDRDEDLCKRASMPWVSHSYTWRGLSHLWGGDVAAALEQFEVAVTLDPPDVWHGGDWGVGESAGTLREGAPPSR